MALQIPRTGLQLEEGSYDHLPTQSFILDLSDDVLDGMIESANQGHEIRLSLGNKPTFLYGTSSYRIEPTFEDETDDIEIFLESADTTGKAERLPQLAMSLFRKPELGNPHYRNSSSEDEDDEYYELGSSPEPEDVDQESYDALHPDIVRLRDSMAQQEAEKHEKSTRVIEGNAPAPNGKNGKRSAGSLQKALSDRRSPFNRSSLSPLPTSPAPSAVGSPSLLPTDSVAHNATEKARKARSPILHELAFKEQPYDILWQKYPGSSEAEFKSALEKVADLDEGSQNYVLRKKYWRELDVWYHEYASKEERQQAIDNAVRTFDKMRLSTTEPEWEKLLPPEERGQGKILSKVQVSIAKGPAAPKIRVQKADDASGDSGNGASNESSESSNNRTDEEGLDSEITLSPSRHATTAATKKKMTAREAQEKRLLSTKKKSPPTPAAARSASPATATKVSPAKSAAARANSHSDNKMGKYKSKEFVSESDTSDSESESAPLAATVHQSKPVANSGKPASLGASKAAAAKVSSAPPLSRERDTKADSKSTPSAAAARKTKPSPVKEPTKTLLPPKPPLKKRARNDDDDDSSSGSSSGTPLSKRIKPLKSATKPSATTTLRDAREKQRPPSLPAQPPVRVSNPSPNGGGSSSGSSGSSGSGSGSSGHANTNGTSSNGTTGSASTKPKNNTSPVKSSPLASSPPTNASEQDLSSEESVPPIGTTNTSRKRKMVDDHRNSLLAAESSNGSKPKKRRHLPEDLVDKALRFKVYYEKYETLYKDIASRSNPPKDRVAELLKMHNRLQEMKTDIHHEAMLQRA